jgi:basic membrane lipoprotein Med (substrate-binding protein (PBP1-ABC) superfamily)
MKRIVRLTLIAVLCLAIPLALFAQAPFKIAVFVPGVTAGSPLYEQMVSGTEKAVKEFPDASMKVIEAGFNQGEWQEKMTSLAATGEYDVIITSNPAMPFITAEVAKSFPKQKFLHLDAYFPPGNPQIYSMLYNQVEQAYFTGYLGGLVTKSSMSGANKDLKAGMIVAQEYPALTKMMKPGYEMGLKAVDPKITVDYRVIGNWYDANKAADLANSMIDAGVDVILSIAGGANQGVIKAAKEKGKYVLFFDSNEYKIAPGTIVGCAVLNQERAAYERVKMAIEGNLPWGKADIVNAKDGYVDFADNDPLYTNNVPASVRQKMAVVVKKIRTGALVLPVPEL